LRSMRFHLVDQGKVDERLPLDEIVTFFMQGAGA
jgi:hypothetical protein